MDCFVVRVNHATMNVYRVRESSVEIRDNREAIYRRVEEAYSHYCYEK
jgi:hypothetical protein